MRLVLASALIVWIVLSITHSLCGFHQDEKKNKPTRRKIVRAARPEFDPAEVERLFFLDAFKQALVGDRPDVLSPSNRLADSGGNDRENPTPETNPTEGKYAWSKVIKAEQLEQEVKRLNGIIDSTVTTPRKFASGAYRDARLHFSMLAVLFGIISEYDGDVRWQENAPIARDLFAKMADNATAGSQAVYNQAKLRKEDLLEIINGGKLSVPGEFDPETHWDDVIDRSPLMERVEIGLGDRIKPWTASVGDFKENRESLLLEAAMFAAIAEVLTREGLPDADQEGYVELAREMRDAALQIVTAIETDDYDLALSAGSLVAESCQNCHDNWR